MSLKLPKRNSLFTELHQNLISCSLMQATFTVKISNWSIHFNERKSVRKENFQQTNKSDDCKSGFPLKNINIMMSQCFQIETSIFSLAKIFKTIFRLCMRKNYVFKSESILFNAIVRAGCAACVGTYAIWGAMNLVQGKLPGCSPWQSDASQRPHVFTTPISESPKRSIKKHLR